MKTIESEKLLLDRQSNIAIWYAEYIGRDEAIKYANEKFSQTFGMPVEQILEKERYHLVNPPDTTAETIEQYRNEDFIAMEQGCFFSCTSIEPGKDLVVVKIPFDRGVLGLFKIVDAFQDRANFSSHQLDEEFRAVLQQLCPGQF